MGGGDRGRKVDYDMGYLREIAAVRAVSLLRDVLARANLMVCLPSLRTMQLRIPGLELRSLSPHDVHHKSDALKGLAPTIISLKFH